MTNYNSHDVAELIANSYGKGIRYTEDRILKIFEKHKPDWYVPGLDKFYCGCQRPLAEEDRKEYYDHIIFLIKNEPLMESPYY